MSEAVILNIKRFEIHDGPGIRSTLFLKGCPLRCKWCHNPESFTSKIQIGYYAHKCVGCGKCVEACPNNCHSIEKTPDGFRHVFDRSKCNGCGKCTEECAEQAMVKFGKFARPEDVIDELLEDKMFYASSGGGVTISGGEPFVQIEFVKEMLTLLKEKGVSCALDTTLYTSRENLDSVQGLVDIFLVDVKAYHSDVHKQLTGVNNEQILDNLRYIDSLGKKYEIRIPLMPGKNEDEIYDIGKFLSSLKNIGEVKLLAYHDLSRTKYESLAMDYPMGDAKLSDEAYEKAYTELCSFGLNVIHK